MGDSLPSGLRRDLLIWGAYLPRSVIELTARRHRRPARNLAEVDYKAQGVAAMWLHVSRGRELALRRRYALRGFFVDHFEVDDINLILR